MTSMEYLRRYANTLPQKQSDVFNVWLDAAGDRWLGSTQPLQRGTAGFELDLAGLFKLTAQVTRSGAVPYANLFTSEKVTDSGHSEVIRMESRVDGWGVKPLNSGLPPQSKWPEYIRVWITQANEKVGDEAVLQNELEKALNRHELLLERLASLNESLERTAEDERKVCAQVEDLKRKLKEVGGIDQPQASN